MDVLLSARRVGPTRGLDMTDEMLALAENNEAETPSAPVLGRMPAQPGCALTASAEWQRA
jgi:hypothetical protein